MGLIPLAVGRSEDPIERTWHRKSLVVDWVYTQFVSYMVKLTWWPDPPAYAVLKPVMPHVQGSIPVFDKSAIRGQKRWTYGQVFVVLPKLLSVDTRCFVFWLVDAVKRYTHFVPFIPSMWRCDAGFSNSGERGALKEGVVSGGR